MLSLGEKILLLRTRHQPRLTQRQVAEEVAVHTQTINQLERGVIQDVQSQTVARLARLFGVSTDYLLGLRDGDGP